MHSQDLQIGRMRGGSEVRSVRDFLCSLPIGLTISLTTYWLSAYEVGLVECLVAFVVETFLFIVLAWYKSAVSPG